MAGPTTGHSLTFQPVAAVSKYHAVVHSGTTPGACTTAGANAVILGICQDEVDAADVANGRQAQVRIDAVVRAVAGAAVACHALVATNASGRLVTATTGQNVVGRALTAAGANGDHMDVLLMVGYIAP